MNLKSLLVTTPLLLSSVAWGADSRQDLTQARSQYRQAVAQHGAQSVEARKARQNLRVTRHNFHAQRRQRKKE